MKPYLKHSFFQGSVIKYSQTHLTVVTTLLQPHSKLIAKINYRIHTYTCTCMHSCTSASNTINQQQSSNTYTHTPNNSMIPLYYNPASSSQPSSYCQILIHKILIKILITKCHPQVTCQLHHSRYQCSASMAITDETRFFYVTARLTEHI